MQGLLEKLRREAAHRVMAAQRTATTVDSVVPHKSDDTLGHAGVGHVNGAGLPPGGHHIISDPCPSCPKRAPWGYGAANMGMDFATLNASLNASLDVMVQEGLDVLVFAAGTCARYNYLGETLLPAAAERNIRVVADFRVVSQLSGYCYVFFKGPKGRRTIGPGGIDWVALVTAVAQMSLVHPNLVAIDFNDLNIGSRDQASDLGKRQYNLATNAGFSLPQLRNITAAAKQVNPKLLFFGVVYMNEPGTRSTYSSSLGQYSLPSPAPSGSVMPAGSAVSMVTEFVVKPPGGVAVGSSEALFSRLEYMEEWNFQLAVPPFRGTPGPGLLRRRVTLNGLTLLDEDLNTKLSCWRGLCQGPRPPGSGMLGRRVSLALNATSLRHATAGKINTLNITLYGVASASAWPSRAQNGVNVWDIRLRDGSGVRSQWLDDPRRDSELSVRFETTWPAAPVKFHTSVVPDTMFGGGNGNWSTFEVLDGVLRYVAPRHPIRAYDIIASHSVSTPMVSASTYILSR